MKSSFARLTAALIGCYIPMVAQAQDGLFNDRPVVELSVDDSAVVRGFAGECGEIPVRPDKDTRKTDLGVLVLGELGQRGSARCNGITPAIAVVFTAIRPGQEKIELFGDMIEISILY